MVLLCIPVHTMTSMAALHNTAWRSREVLCCRSNHEHWLATVSFVHRVCDNDQDGGLTGSDIMIAWPIYWKGCEIMCLCLKLKISQFTLFQRTIERVSVEGSRSMFKTWGSQSGERAVWAGHLWSGEVSSDTEGAPRVLWSLHRWNVSFVLPAPQFLERLVRPEARCPARRMLVNAREWRNIVTWSGVAYTTSGSKARSNARWPGRSLAFKTRWRMCFSYKSFTFICFHANFSSFSFVDRQNTYSCKSDLFAN